MASNKRVGSKKLNEVVHGLTSKVYGKYGFLNGTIVQDWQKIVGADYANSIFPEKITFPARKRNHGVLTVKASSHSTALIFQHIHAYVIDRINMYYGYRAIDKIKVIVGKVHIPAQEVQEIKKINISKTEENTIEKLVENIDNKELKESLKNLGRRIFSKNIENNENKPK